MRPTPDELGYKDRGKMKWQGLMLSDHTEKLRRIKADAEPPKPKEIMDEVEIARILQLAYLNKAPVNIQANILKDGNFYDDLNCMVVGYNENRIYLVLKDNRQINCTLEDIRHIEFANVYDWYEK